MKKLVPIPVASLALAGCTEEKRPTPPPPVVQPPAEPAYQRFVPVSRTAIAPDFALDTKTGQLRKTWDWHYKDETKAREPYLQDLSTCLALYTAYPD